MRACSKEVMDGPRLFEGTKCTLRKRAMLAHRSCILSQSSKKKLGRSTIFEKGICPVSMARFPQWRTYRYEERYRPKEAFIEEDAVLVRRFAAAKRNSNTGESNPY